MKTRVIKVSAISMFGVLASLSSVGVRPVLAETIVIENNGSDSSNEVTVTQQTETTVEQSNNAEITNNVEAEANTGNNEASENTGGETSIQTGDAEVNVEVTNAGNVNTADADCCTEPEEGTVSISGNGAGSDNNVHVSTSHTNNVTVTNQATVTNSVNGKATTGKNKANNNNGDVIIKTGNITATETITNGPFNLNSISISQNFHSDYSISVKDNGADSENEISLNEHTENNINVINDFNVENNSEWDLVTGENFANGNLGDVIIGTGDITFTSTITSKGNVNVVDVKCCDKDKEKPEVPEEPKVPPTKPPGGNGGHGNGNGNGGNGNGDGKGGPDEGAAAGDILPVTGGNTFFLFVLANTLFLLFGLFMRLRAGRSPGMALSI